VYRGEPARRRPGRRRARADARLETRRQGDRANLSFSGFQGGEVFVNWVAALAERANHHPDMTIHYNEVTVSVWTHSDGGLTPKDFALARGIDAL
jgi:4a-hydroxytetrahydrobiopterin dehydratase